ncbi:MAG: hypothetical protein CL814_06135 [Confluentimicrobium sp.]|jgi:hypothetical protein|uniref:hypothetical protein n=1 Tax=Actibacterium sp. TaxID=1872125 RepID=UPI000C53343C|nr:hypothetical protein [Actibacterium sp.]MBC56499.1 hypothetical protein [Actibacterium sp.]MDY6857712.1 hypothetical protein [Pseudomonadota bacterium]|tara:strand:- start:5418 stop:5720 length:303 start_codon:yes stop_codon:yes gene_type:complete
MTFFKAFTLLPVVALVAACETNHGDKTIDGGVLDNKRLSEMRAGIWVDPNGCDHWMIDDGAEGYMDIRRDKYGRPVCSGIAPPGSVVGPFKAGSPVEDPV